MLSAMVYLIAVQSRADAVSPNLEASDCSNSQASMAWQRSGVQGEEQMRAADMAEKAQPSLIGEMSVILVAIVLARST